MTLFELASIGNLLGAPVAGAIVGMRSSLGGLGIGFAIGLAIGLAFHFGVCKLLQVLLLKAEALRKNTDVKDVRKSRPPTTVLNSITNVLGETTLFALLLSPLLSIPVTVYVVRLAEIP